MTNPHPILSALRAGPATVYTVAVRLRRMDRTREWNNEDVEREMSPLIRAALVSELPCDKTGHCDYVLTKAGLKAIMPAQRKKGKKGA